MEGTFLTRQTSTKRANASQDHELKMDTVQIKQCIKLTQDYLSQMNAVLSQKNKNKAQKKDEKVIVIDDDEDGDGSYGTY